LALKMAGADRFSSVPALRSNDDGANPDREDAPLAGWRHHAKKSA
jgi:hypothetical protein